jgi:anaerobic ribonucleoside-triphosphate reductase activating protein
MKPELFDFEAGSRVAVAALVKRIFEIRGLEGVTFSGGEPFEQAVPLAALAKQLRRGGLSILVYSGYAISSLRASPERFGPLLQETDLLVDGEYRVEVPGPLLWRGSANQSVHALTTRGASLVAAVPTHQSVREVQVSLTHEGVRLSGFPSRSVQRELTRRLAERGIHLSASEAQQ